MKAWFAIFLSCVSLLLNLKNYQDISVLFDATRTVTAEMIRVIEGMLAGSF